jgi:hypothetical protein
MDVPRDRPGSLEPQLIVKHERRLTGFDNKVINMYARASKGQKILIFLVEKIDKLWPVKRVTVLPRYAITKAQAARHHSLLA